ncbi:TM2 domain-containing protein [Pseudomonas sp. MWU12-2323]|uniref:TM2 domain-containing protein n=1 Tax=Pseudomonas sp. MWU12-2323 TaxID=2651296 RepID=UPI00128BC5CE|nr:TM2 domain-containing protein [Pseudomonas sp. MWU12-2323]MPQ69350.1 TM2 domain-containing protein [Pseudomonas sp. MWU12-2323]
MTLKKLYIVALLSASVLTSGCATHLSPGQEREYDAYAAKGLVQEEKSVALAAALGVLPVAGYAYTGHPILAVTSILMWPFLGPLWMPIDTGLAAKNSNYFSTQEHVERLKRQSLAEIDEKLQDKQITYEQHLREQRDIEAKYSPY